MNGHVCAKLKQCQDDTFYNLSHNIAVGAPCLWGFMISQILWWGSYAGFSSSFCYAKRWEHIGPHSCSTVSQFWKLLCGVQVIWLLPSKGAEQHPIQNPEGLWRTGSPLHLCCKLGTRILHGISIDYHGLWWIARGFWWIMHGLCVNYVWIMYGLCVDDASIMHGFCVEYARTLRDICADCVWMVHGLCLDDVWVMYRLCTD